MVSTFSARSCSLGLSMVRPILGSLEKAILFYEHHIAPQSTAQSAQSGILSASSSNNTEGAAVKKVSFSLKRPQEFVSVGLLVRGTVGLG